MADIIRITDAKTITVTFTREAAFALDELIERAMMRLVTEKAVRTKSTKRVARMEAAAGACDKLRQAILTVRNPLPWKQSLKDLS